MVMTVGSFELKLLRTGTERMASSSALIVAVCSAAHSNGKLLLRTVRGLDISEEFLINYL